MSGAGAGRRRIRLAPDWLPNTNHLGFYAAEEQGYYADEGLELDVLPFDGEAMPNRKIVSGETDFGLMPHQSVISMRARGVDVVSVAALVQPNTTSIMARADSVIVRPAQFAGRRYASFGTEFEVPLLEELIRLDGGSGGPEVVDAEKLDIQGALLDGTLDLAWGFYAWEGMQAELVGAQLRHFFVTQHGLPGEYFPLLFTTRPTIERESAVVAAFTRATARGYRFAAAHPVEAAASLLRRVPATQLPPAPEPLARRSAEWLATRFAGAEHPWGWHDPQRWSAFAALIRRLAAERGLTAPEPEAEARGFTNEFVTA